LEKHADVQVRDKDPRRTAFALDGSRRHRIVGIDQVILEKDQRGMGFSGGWEAIGPRDTQGDEEVPLRIVGSRDKISESVDPSRITQPAMERRTW
jgi:hypothetical protein